MLFFKGLAKFWLTVCISIGWCHYLLTYMGDRVMHACFIFAAMLQKLESCSEMDKTNSKKKLKQQKKLEMTWQHDMRFFAEPSCIAGRARWHLPFINNCFFCQFERLWDTFFMCHISWDGQGYVLNNSPAALVSEENSAALFGFQAPKIFIWVRMNENLTRHFRLFPSK